MINYSPGKTYKQDVPAAEWTIVHGRNRPIAVTVCTYLTDGLLHQVLPQDVIIVDSNTVKIVFPYAVRGEVRIA